MVWKSDKQGVKEETFIQTGRRGRDGKPRRRGHKARQRQMHCMGQAAAGSPGQSHVQVQISREKQVGSETDHTIQGSSTRK